MVGDCAERKSNTKYFTENQSENNTSTRHFWSLFEKKIPVFSMTKLVVSDAIPVFSMTKLVVSDAE